MMLDSEAELDAAQIRVTLRQIVSEVIDQDLSEIEDDVPILDIVASSLALVEGMRRVYERFGVLISIRSLIEGALDLGGLAVYIDQELAAQRRQAGGRALPKSKPGDEIFYQRPQEIPLAASQRHVAFLSRYSKEASAAFNEALAVRLEGRLDGPALRAAITFVGGRYEALRTALSPDHDALDLQAGGELELSVAHCPADQLHGRLAEIVARPFESGERLFRAVLLRMSDTTHALVLVGHAVVVDRDALTVVLAEIATLYSAYARDEEEDGTPAAIQWTEYLERAEAESARQAKVAAERYWQEIFSQGIPRLELPSDHARPPIKNYQGGRISVTMDSELRAATVKWAATNGTAPFAAIFGAYTAYLHRLSGQREIVIGTLCERLYLDAGERAVTQSRNMLPVPAVYEPERSFTEHVLTQAALLDEANRHRHLSLAEIIQLLQIPRDQSRSALFTAAFLHEAIGQPPAFEPLDTTYVERPVSAARYDLALTWSVEGDVWRLHCEYSTELFAEETVSRWLQGMLVLLHSGLQESSTVCGRLPIMSEDLRRQLLLDWNETESPYPQQRTLLDLIDKQFSARGGQVAIRFGNEELTYGQLQERVAHIAGHLKVRGVGIGDRVAILLERSPDLVAAMLATWRAEALYVPLDPSFPSQRLAYMMSDAEIHAVISSRNLSKVAMEATDAPVLIIEEMDADPAGELGQVPAKASDSAYIIYTSGSTGRPKGVEVGHRSLVNLVLASRALLGFSEKDTLLAITTVSFDISVLELLMPLVAGGVVDLAEDGLAADGLGLVERIERRKPAFVQATPSTWKAVLAAGWKGDGDLHLLAGGESLSRELAEQLLEKGKTLWNLYGPTETTVWATAKRMTSAPGRPVPIGRPFPNTQLYILDEGQQPVALGGVGELLIGGDGLAKGYWKQSELTGERFISNPFRPGTRLYRTGDLAYYLPDGNVVCLGRVDDQVKIHGVRVELEEVEAALRSIAGVHDVVVTSWVDPAGSRQLVGHIMSNGSVAPEPAAIRAALRQRLPEVMIPPYLLFSDEFPMTSNGKVHRALLPVPDSARAAHHKPDSPPATTTEKLLAEAWAGVLGINQNTIGRDDDFMDLGGHSLLMTPLMLEVRKLFQVSFSMRDFFGAPTVRQFAALIDERRRAQTKATNGNRSSRPLRNAEWGRQRMAFLQREAQLPPQLAPARGMLYLPQRETRAMLMTGATGFLGAYLVAEILQTTDAHLYCLVRPKRGEDSRRRIEKQMRHYDIWPNNESWQMNWNRRLHVVEGDVTLPRMGMADVAYETLAREVDSILHGAAHVNFIYPYEALRATNVLGVHEVIRFAFHARIKPVHHLSTAAIWPMGAEYTFYERDAIDHNLPLNLGYDEAKWVGEKCLLHAAERGLPVARYRPGEVGGDSVTGRCVTDHFLIACIKGFLQAGAFPSLDIEVDVAPVDYVAKAVVHLAFRKNPLGRAFHLTNPWRRHMSEALTFLRSLGYRFAELRFGELRDRLVSSPDFVKNALFAYQATLEDMDDVSLQLPTYDTADTLRELDGSGISCPPADEKLFDTYMNYLTTTGYMPQPGELAWAEQTYVT